jgi:hypothetical protein
MRTTRPLIERCLLPALAGALAVALFLALGAGSARAESIFGGLGHTGSAIKAGTGSGQVNTLGDHNFAVDPETGDLFVADELEKSVEVKPGVFQNRNFGRVQQFTPKGELLAEGSVRLTEGTAAEIGGIALDSQEKRLYLLVNEERPREEGETLIFDAEAKAADQIYSFSLEKKLERKLLTKEAAELKPLSETPKAPLLAPAGIAVDPTTHDVVILGQQDESTIPGPGEEQFRAAVERVHASGSSPTGALGPRYVDKGNCLDGAEPSPEEKASHEKPCGERNGQGPRSPIVTPLGRVYVEVENEVWEIPSPSSAESEVVVHPNRVFALPPQVLLVTEGQEGQAGTMSFASLAGGKGLIYISTAIAGESGVLVLNYADGGGKAEVSERGWTGGQSVVSGEHKCAIPIAGRSPLVAAGSGEEAVVFDASLESHIELLAFGPGAEAEACGHVKVSTPAVKVGEEPNASTVETGKLATFISTLTGANAKGTKWKIVFDKGKAGEKIEEFTSGYQHDLTELEHVFTQVGEYEITETVESDSLGHPTVASEGAKLLTAAPSPPKVSVVAPKAAVVGEAVTFEAHVTDNNEAKPHLTYKWTFGDGSPQLVETEAAGEATVVHKTTHAFVSRCSPPKHCVVKLEVLDEAGAPAGKATAEVAVGESAAEKEAREREAREKEPPPSTGPPLPPAPAGPSAEELARQKAEQERQEVLAFQAKHNPEAKVAGTALTVSKKGVMVLKISCPFSEVTACAGTVTLRTLTAVSAKAKKAILTLAGGSFSVAGGQTKTLTLHLSAKARTLLARMHVLKALATIVSSDSAKVTRTTKSTVTLRRGKR